VDSLVALGSPAILHVDEPVANGTTINHAVALLGIDSATGTATVGNPLRGLQIVHFDELDVYWSGEAAIIELVGGGT
jgi:hypothetical protein